MGYLGGLHYLAQDDGPPLPGFPFEDFGNLGVGYLLPVLYLLWSLKWGKVSGTNPWGATGLEWQIPSPPPTENFTEVPHVTWEPYDYSRRPHPAVAVSPNAGEHGGHHAIATRP